jgi:prepilin-type N-terminal cleavage/methylation domain-containing protein
MNRSRKHAARRSGREGFTLIELGIVVVIIGLLATMAIMSFSQFRQRAAYTSCVTNQRNVLQASMLYASLTNPGNKNVDVSLLAAAGFINSDIGKCPADPAHGNNDYTVTIVNNAVSAITCNVEPVQHAWTLP